MFKKKKWTEDMLLLSKIQDHLSYANYFKTAEKTPPILRQVISNSHWHLRMLSASKIMQFHLAGSHTTLA